MDKKEIQKRKLESIKQAQALERNARQLMSKTMGTKFIPDKRRGAPKPWKSNED